MRLYGLIGKTLKHSFSKDFFTKKFTAESRIDCSYVNFEIPSIDEFPTLITSTAHLKGLNVTIPFKESVIPYVHFKNEVVTSINACNCIKIDKDELWGYNTDVIGFKSSLIRYLQPHHTRALVLGTGGAAKAVQYVLEDLYIPYVNVSRQRKENCIMYEDIDETILAEHTMIINATPVGMYPQTGAAPSIPYQYITPKHLLYDLIYNPAKTKFLAEGEKQGAAVCNGYEMLILQAEESWTIWNS